MKQSLSLPLAALVLSIATGAQAADDTKTPAAKSTIEPSNKAEQAISESEAKRVKTGASGSNSSAAGASKVVEPANGPDRDTDIPVKAPAGPKIDKPK